MVAQTVNHIWRASLALSEPGVDVMLPAAIWLVFVLGVLSGLTLGILVSRIKSTVEADDELEVEDDAAPPREPWEQDADAWKRGSHDR